MTDKLPTGKGKITVQRALIWLVVGAIGVYLLATGIIGILVKGHA